MGARHRAIEVVSITLLLLVAAIMGAAVNYSIGNYLGPKLRS